MGFLSDVFGGSGGGIIGGALGFLGGERQNSSAAGMSREQMDFQERMRNTAYQAAAQDLEKAGLNRTLAITQGAASSPSGSMAPVVNSAASAIEGFAKAKSLQNLDAQNELLQAQRHKADAETANTAAHTRILNTNADKAEVTRAPYKWLGSTVQQVEDRFNKIKADPFNAEFPNPVNWLIKKYKENRK